MDEVSTLGPTQIVSLEDGVITPREEQVPLPVPQPEELKGGDAACNAKILSGILEGQIHGPKRDIVLANAAAAFQACGHCDSWASGLRLAGESIDSGAARDVLEKLRAFPRGGAA